MHVVSHLRKCGGPPQVGYDDDCVREIEEEDERAWGEERHFGYTMDIIYACFKFIY